MSHNIASVSQAAFLPQQTGPGISAVQSQPSFGFEETDAFERKEPKYKSSKGRQGQSNEHKPTNPLYRLVMMIRRILQTIWNPIAKALLS